MEIQYVVKLAIVLIFLFIVSISAYGAYNKYVYPEFAAKYKTAVDSSTKSYVESQFDSFFNNINICKTAAKQVCSCKNIIPNYPNTLSGDFSLKLSSAKGGLRISLVYKGREEVKNATIDNLFIVSASYSTQLKENEAKLESIMTFKEGKVLLDGKQVLSQDFYKISSARIAILTGGDLNKINALQAC